MTELLKERQVNDFIIAYVVDSDSYAVKGWTIAHLDMERATAELFESSAQAQEWGDKNYRGLLCS